LFHIDIELGDDMNVIKKTFAVFAMVAMVGGLATGCSSSEKQIEEESITADLEDMDSMGMEDELVSDELALGASSSGRGR